MKRKSAIVIGAGIVGLATARALAVRGYEVTIFERSPAAAGASIRNFGMIWPIGMPTGPLFERALVSRSIWKEICTEAKIWHEETGSLHVAYEEDEWRVMQEYVAHNRHFRQCDGLSASRVQQLSPGVNPQGLKGALHSREEMLVEARQAIPQIAAWLKEKYAIRFFWNTAITKVRYPVVCSDSQSWSADNIFVCSGADFETLYPEYYRQSPITKCKLQMMRLVAQPASWRLGPPLCGALSMIHYAGFKVADSLPALKQRMENQYPDLLKWGIHVMIAQNEAGEMTVGDSHEYGLAPDPFDKDFINKMILDYLKTFTIIKDWQLLQSWHGIYPKMTNGTTDLILSPENGVTIVNALGGAGMTLSFGLMEELIGKL